MSAGLPSWRAFPGASGSFSALASPLPAAVAGGIAIVGVVILAVAIRAPLEDAVDAPLVSAVVASPAPPPTVAPTAPTPAPLAIAPSAQPPEDASDGASVYERRSEFLRQLQRGHLGDALDSFEGITTTDAPALEDDEIRGGILDLVLRLAVANDRNTDRAFETLATRTGTHGPDLLYELVTTKGGSRASKRAEDMLRDETLRARGTPALRIAYDLRATRCGDKPSLFERAAADGDRRTLGQLTMLNQDCRRGWRRATDCCFPRDPALLAALDALRERLH